LGSGSGPAVCWMHAAVKAPMDEIVMRRSPI
jgi:hypothetical protein